MGSWETGSSPGACWQLIWCMHWERTKESPVANKTEGEDQHSRLSLSFTHMWNTHAVYTHVSAFALTQMCVHTHAGNPPQHTQVSCMWSWHQNFSLLWGCCRLHLSLVYPPRDMRAVPTFLALVTAAVSRDTFALGHFSSFHRSVQ